MSSNVNANDYVVLDVETNGLSSIRDDLLSISIFKPDDNKIYDRFLPLELSNEVETTYINGITKEMLKDKSPLTQKEFDKVINDFELEKRIILIYGSIDEKFIKNYLKRKKIKGFDKLRFYNFKHDIISSRFSEGNITKDNLCKIYGINNIQEIHTGLNDCILEWNLFQKMNGNKLIIINNDVFEFNDDYIIPVSYLTTYTNFKYCIKDFPKIDAEIKEIKKIRIDSSEIKKFETNISGISIEHLINTLLNVKDMNSETFLFQLENKKKLKKLGKLPSMIHQIPILLNRDGTITALNKEDEKRVNEVNKVTNIIKEKIKPLIKYIKADVFDNELIMSQELVINKKDNVLAKCDLSTKNKILEIKAFIPDIDKIKYQLYYEANGREIYILQTKWNRNLKKGLIFTLYKVDILENTKKIKKINDNLNNPKINKKALERKVAKRVSNYFNEEGNRWSLGCMTFKSTDDFNYQYLKEYINKNKINIKELSASIDVSENAVRNWINGKSRPYVWNAIAICICLDIDERKIIIKK